jgi:hypothetical protein
MHPTQNISKNSRSPLCICYETQPTLAGRQKPLLSVTPPTNPTKTVFPIPAQQPDRAFMDTQLLYVTFTNKKVVTSMILLGIVLGLVLSSLLSFLAGKWYMPTVFVGICLFVAIVYMYWLDGQDWRNM